MMIVANAATIALAVPCRATVSSPDEQLMRGPGGSGADEPAQAPTFGWPMGTVPSVWPAPCLSLRPPDITLAQVLQCERAIDRMRAGGIAAPKPAGRPTASSRSGAAEAVPVVARRRAPSRRRRHNPAPVATHSKPSHAADFGGASDIPAATVALLALLLAPFVGVLGHSARRFGTAGRFGMARRFGTAGRFGTARRFGTAGPGRSRRSPMPSRTCP
jgi:hypothetical protein